MPALMDHPTAQRVLSRRDDREPSPSPLDADWLATVALEAGADDVGFVTIDDPALGDERDHAAAALPGVRTLVSFVCRMNRGPIRSTARSAANLEFHHVGDQVNDVARRIVTALERRGVAALNPAMGFPMEMDRFPGRVWIIQHKTVAVAAGLGVMGIHRNVIHPKFGNFILLGTVLVDADIDTSSEPLSFNPCLECKLCVAACPVGAIASDGRFDFSACYTHNYREFMGGFTDWVETVADAPNAASYRAEVTDAESSSMWQSLSFGANYKAAYCLAVCPAGEDVIGPLLDDRKGFVKDVVRPLQDKEETIYAVPGSDAGAHTRKRFPHKTVKAVSNSLRPVTIEGFLQGLPLVFQRGQARDLHATYHFTFTGDDQAQATVTIRDGELVVEDGHNGSADLAVTADSRTWLRFLRKDQNIVTALLLRKIKLRGSPRLLLAFGRCFLA